MGLSIGPWHGHAQVNNTHSLKTSPTWHFDTMLPWLSELFVYFMCVCIHACTIGDIPCIKARGQLWVLVLRNQPLWFLRHWHLLNLLISRPLGCACLCLPKATIASTDHHSWLFTWVLGTHLYVHILTRQALHSWSYKWDLFPTDFCPRFSHQSNYIACIWPLFLVELKYYVKFITSLRYCKWLWLLISGYSKSLIFLRWNFPSISWLTRIRMTSLKTRMREQLGRFPEKPRLSWHSAYKSLSLYRC